jgi:serine/threonine protein kinase
VRSVNKRDGMISPAELKYLQKYSRQHVRSVASYVSVKPGKPRVEKTSIIMDEFECDLCALSESDASRKIQLTSIADITRQIATTVQSMHAEGDIHRDLKGKNILYRVDPESGLEEVVVADFGLTYHAKTDTQQKECYGTANFTSPERLKGIKPTTEEERLQQGIADDMFAMGCLLFELLHRKRIPWGSDIREYYMKSNAKAKVRGLERYEKTLDALKIEVEKSADLKEKMLLQCCLQLLNPNPKERWQTTPLLNALGAGPA